MLFLFTSTMSTTVNYLTFSMTIWGSKCNIMHGSHHHTESMTVLKNRFISQIQCIDANPNAYRSPAGNLK